MLDEPAAVPGSALARELSALLGEGASRSAHVKVHPPALGEVALAVDLCGDRVRATLTVASPAAHAVLSAGAGALGNAVAASGLRLDSLDVALGAGGSSGNNSSSRPPPADPRDAPKGSHAPIEPALDASPVSRRSRTRQGRVHVYA